MTGRYVVVLLALAILGVGCSPSVAFLGDPALRLTIGDTGEFETRLGEVARKSDQRLLVEWDPSTELGTAWFESEVAELEVDIIVLSPYFSLFATEFAMTRPGTSFIAFGGGGGGAGSGPENLTRVVFDTVPAMEEAGSLLARWQEGGPQRSVAVLHLSGSGESQSELAALESSLERQMQYLPPVVEFDSEPGRDQVRQELRDLLAGGHNGFLVRLGGATQHALDLLQTEPVVFATDAARGASALNEAILFSIERPLDEGMRAGLEAVKLGVPGTVTVAATIVLGEGFGNPQLQALPQADE